MTRKTGGGIRLLRLDELFIPKALLSPLAGVTKTEPWRELVWESVYIGTNETRHAEN